VLAPAAATAANLYVAVYSSTSGDPLAPSAALNVSLETNGVATSLSCTVGTSATTCSNTLNSVALSAGQPFGLVINSSVSQSLEVTVSFGLT
jgi:hypothetical protein